jgi:hypothetical protein
MRADDCGGGGGSEGAANIGFFAHVEPMGLVPLSTQAPGMERRVPLFQRSCCFVRSNWSGIFMKHSSVSGSSAGHRRYWYLRHRHAALFSDGGSGGDGGGAPAAVRSSGRVTTLTRHHG